MIVGKSKTFPSVCGKPVVSLEVTPSGFPQERQSWHFHKAERFSASMRLDKIKPPPYSALPSISAPCAKGEPLFAHRTV